MNESENQSLLFVKAVVPMTYHAFDDASGAHMLRVDTRWIDPFIGIDSFTMPKPFFRPHPHAGMSAVSLMLPESDSAVANRDSLGDHSLIRPGDLHWTQAGRGMMHEEKPAEPGKAARGMQVFVNLSRANKMADPQAFKVKHEETPVITSDGGSVRVVTGQLNGHVSPISGNPHWLTPVNMFDVSLQAGAGVDIPVKPGDNAFFVIRSGSFDAPENHDATQSAIIFEPSTAPERTMARLKAGSQALRGVFFSGTPLNEPVFPGGPFMGNSAQDIAAFKQAFARGDMGHLDASF